MILIQNGYLCDPKSKREEKADVLIREGKIVKIRTSISAGDIVKEYGEEPEIVEAKGLTIAPGLVDVHVHFRDPGFTYKEDIYTGAKAAAKGGFTSVVLMANTKPAVDNPDTLKEVLEKGNRTDIRVYTCANVTRGLKGEELVDMDLLKKEGAVGFTDDGIPIMDAALLQRAMETAGRLNVPSSLHEEDPAYIENAGVNKGKVSDKLGIGGASREAEIVMVERDLEIAKKTGVSVDIQHISSKEAVDLVRQAKRDGVNVHAEATPHHFTLTDEAVLTYGTLAKMNPPVREESDRMAIIQGLQDGTIDLIATDHAPHSKEEKDRPFTQAPSGILGLETALALGITELVDKGYLTMNRLLEKMSLNPAQMYHLDAGYVAVDGPADLILVDKDAEYIPGDYLSKSANCPFTGWRLKGKVVMTICKGKIIYTA